jgi:hypothetical protein
MNRGDLDTGKKKIPEGLGFSVIVVTEGYRSKFLNKI